MRHALAAATLVAVLAAGAFAGCIRPAAVQPSAVAAGALSPATFDLNATKVERLSLKVADGTTLALAVHRPPTSEKVPVIVDIGPYFRKDIEKYVAIDQRMAEYFVPRGFAMARAALRGTGASEGCFTIGDASEQKDVHDIVEFLASQPWSNGKVAVFGKSYDGTTPWEAAITHPKGLATIVPISGMTDLYRYTYYDGAVYGHGPIFNTYYPLSVDYDVDPLGVPPRADATNAQQNVVRTCADVAPEMEKGFETTATGDHDAYWKARDFEPKLREVTTPVFLVHGLADWNVKPDNGVPMYGALAGPKMMWLGQWEHDYPDINHHKSAWSRHDWNETLLSWFDHWLKDKPTDWETRAHVEAQDQAGTWTNSTSWPPASAERVTMFLAPKMRLAERAGAAAAVAFSDPFAMGYNASRGENGVAFLTGAFSKNVTLVGRPSATLFLSVDRPGGNVAVALYDVAPDGSWTEIDRGYKELRHRASRESGTPVVPGETFNVTVDLYPQELTLAAGHKLALSVGTEMPNWILPSPFAGARVTLLTGAGHASALDVLVRENQSRDALAALAASTAAGKAATPAALPALPALG